MSQRDHTLEPRPPFPLASLLPSPSVSWPLLERPSVQPHLDLAMAHDVCTGELVQRHARDAELVAYITAWCRIRASDRGAIDDLGKLARDARPELQRAARLDVVNLIADDEIANDAVKHLDALGLGTPAVLDLLAGTYRALGSDEDAMIVGATVLAFPAESPRVGCERMLAWAMFDDHTFDALQRIDASVGDCWQRARDLTCLISSSTSATPTFTAQQCHVQADADLDNRLKVLRAYQTWPTTPTSPGRARVYIHVLHVLGAEELAVTALENAVLSSPCEAGPFFIDLRDTATELLEADGHSHRFDQRLHALVTLDVPRCRAFVAR